jgi:ABC-type uncharacterized transport system auxiliary subunit
MGRYRNAWMLFPGLLLLVASCGSLNKPSHKIEHYSLEYEPARMAELKPLSHVMRVERFSVAPVYNTHQIIYREASFRRDAYVYHRWRSNPGDLVTYFLTRDMKQSGLFRAVIPYDSRQTSSFVLEGSVDEFFESDSEDFWEAVLTFSVTLTAENEPDISKRVLFQKTYHAKKPCKMKNPRALAEGMSEAMAQLSRQMIVDIHGVLKNAA